MMAAMPRDTSTRFEGVYARHRQACAIEHGTYAHTSGTSTATLTGTFTANGSDSLPVTVAKIGLRRSAPLARSARDRSRPPLPGPLGPYTCP